MLKAVHSWLLFIITIVVMFFLLIPLMLTDSVTSENVITYKGHYQNLIQNWYRGDFSYNLLTTEGETYKIASSYSSCFQYKDFLKEVSPGKVLIIKLKENKGYIFSDYKVLTSLEMNGKLYLEPSCFNNSLYEERIYSPLVVFAVLGVLYITLLYGERKKASTIKYRR